MGCCKTRDVSIRQKDSGDDKLIENSEVKKLVDGAGGRPKEVEGKKEFTDSEIDTARKTAEWNHSDFLDPSDPENFTELSIPIITLVPSNKQIPPKGFVSPLEQALQRFHEEEEQRDTFGPVKELNSPREILSSVVSDHISPTNLSDQEERYHGVPISMLNLEFSDPEFREIEQYSSQLSTSLHWSTLLSHPGFSLSILPKSKFTSEAPVLMCDLDFQQPIPADILLDCLDNYETRAKWDSSVIRMKRLYSEIGNFFTHYHVLSLHPITENRDFLCKSAVRKAGNDTIFAIKSVSAAAVRSPIDENNETIRGKVQFGCLRFTEEESVTRVKGIIQVLMYFEDEGIAEEMPKAVGEWMERFRQGAGRVFEEIEARRAGG